MSRQIQTTGNCTGCEELYEVGQSHCVCGRPTPYASFEDRAAYEVAAWRIYQESREQAAV
jgi:hypothetical protein